MVLKNIVKSPFFGCLIFLGVAAGIYYGNLLSSCHSFLSSISSGKLDALTKESSITAKDVVTEIAPLQTTSHSHLLGFKSNSAQHEPQTLKSPGNVPFWLHGSFLSIGPSVFEIGTTKATHWLDGFAMIHKFSFDNQSVVYSNKLLNSSYYQSYCEKRKMRGSGSDQKQSTWSKLTSAISNSNSRPVYDNTNVNIACFNNQYLALTETPHAIPFDRTTLASKSTFTFNDSLDAHFCSAHHLYDSTTQETYGLAIKYGHTSNYIVYKIKDKTTQRIPIATIPVGYPSYMHSFAMTKNYIILTEAPFTVSPYDLLLSDTTFIENFTWNARTGTTFIVIDKETGQKVGSYKVEPFFVLHHINAFEKEGKIIVDLIAYKDPAIVKCFLYENACKATNKLPAGTAKRFTIQPAQSKVAVTSLSPLAMELPHINKKFLKQEYRYLYATALEDGITTQLIKLDLQNNTSLTWHSKGCYPTEPIFVPRPGATEEDDGAILCLTLDGVAQKSFLLILEAKTFKEMARVYAPHHIPFTVHSTFVNS